MEQTVRQCNIRITARYASNSFFFISHIYLYNNIYFSLVCASRAFHEDFRLDRSFGFCEKRRYRARFVHFVPYEIFFSFVFRYFPFFFFRFFVFSPFLFTSFQAPPHAGRLCNCERVAHLLAS